MSFTRPDLLWLAGVLPAVVGAAVFAYARRRRRVASLLGDDDLVRRLGGGALRRFPVRRLVLVALAAAALGAAAAGPRWGERVVETQRRSLDLVLALDVSKSMWARDLSPDRLERERLLSRRLLRELEGDRIGLVAFAGRAYVLSPLTVDHSALQLYLDALDPQIVSQGGSSLASALQQAVDLARGESTGHADRAVILVSDGEALEEEDAVVAAAERAAAAGVVVFPVGVGTPDGAPVPEHDAGTGEVTGYKRDVSGEVVVSRRNDRLLGRIAGITGGSYVRADDAGATDRLLAELQDLQRAQTSDGSRRQERERFTWFIALALILLASDAVLARGIPLRGLLPWPRRRFRPGLAGVFSRDALALIAVCALLGFGIGDLERGNRLYREGKYEEAVEAYREALADGEDSPVLHYNLGTALLRLGRYDEAEQQLQAALASIDRDTRQHTHYNLGNRFLDAGREASDPTSREKLLDAAIETYKRALRLNPGDVDAKWNLELAQRERERQPPPQSGGGAQSRNRQDQPRTGQGGTGSQAPTGSSSSRSGAGRDRDPGAMSREQAERILSAVAQDERDLFREKLRKGRRDTPVARDW